MAIECNTIFNKYVYQHRRLDTGDIFYIGIGTGNNTKRANNKSTRNGLWKKIENKTKYSIEILFNNLTLKEACDIEKYLIKYYGRKDLKTGSLCNMTNGGEGVSSPSYERRQKIAEQSRNRVWTKEAREKLRNSRLGKQVSEYQLYKIRESSKKRKGIKLSEEIKLKMSKSSYQSKKVIDMSTNIVYESATKVSKIFNINQNTLRSYLTGIRTNKTTFKYI